MTLNQGKVAAVARFAAVALVCLSTVAARSKTSAPKRQEIELGADRRLAQLWRQPLIRQGFARTASDSFGAAAISTITSTVVVGNAEGVLQGLDLADGHPLWRLHLSAPIESEISLMRSAAGAKSNKTGAETALVGSLDGFLWAVDVASGTVRWRTKLEAETRAAAALSRDKIVITTAHNQVVAVAPATGEQLWTAGRPPPTGLSLQGHSSACIFKDQVFATFSDGFAAAYALEDGQELWTRPLSLSPGRFVDADAHPAVVDGRLFVASVSDGVYALDLKDGHTLWQQPIGQVGSLLPQGGHLFAADVEGGLWRLSQATGRVQAHVQLGHEPLAGLTSLGDAVLLAAGDHGLVVLGHNGRPSGAQPLGGRPGESITAAHGHVAHISRAGHLTVWQDLLRVPPMPRTLGG